MDIFSEDYLFYYSILIFHYIVYEILEIIYECFYSFSFTPF
jgi:hypothetical protein